MKIKQYLSFITLILLVLLFSSLWGGISYVSALERSSGNFGMDADALTGGGVTAESTNFKVENSTAGESAVTGSMESTNYKVYGQFQETLGTAPMKATALQQYRTDEVTVIATGEWISGDTVVVKFTINDPDPSDFLMPQVEVEPVGTAFDNVPNKSGNEVPWTGSPVTAVVTLDALSDDIGYHWQARVIDSELRTSSWESFGNNTESEIDFGLSSTSPMVTLEAPNGFEGYISGYYANISWEATHLSGITSIALWYSSGESYPYILIDSGLANTGGYLWNVPDIRSDTVRVSIEATAGNGEKAYDTSDDDFLIAPADTYVSNGGSDTTGNGTATNPFKTIQKALDWCPSYGSVKIFGGTYSGTGNAGINWPKRSNITLITSTETSIVTVDAVGISYFVTTEATVQLSMESIGVTNCSGNTGIGRVMFMLPGSRIDLNKTRIFYNKLSSAANSSIYVPDGYAYLNNSTFYDNETRDIGSGTIIVGGSIEANNCTFRNNVTNSGNITATNILKLTNCYYYANGGNSGSNISAPLVVVDNCTFEANGLAQNGGGVGTGGTWYVTNSMFKENTGSICPAVFSNVTLVATNCAFVSNRSNNGVAGFSGGGNINLFNCTLANNTDASGSDGDAIYDPTSLYAVNTIIWGTDNQIYAPSGSRILKYCVVQNADWSGATTTECTSADPLMMNSYGYDLRLIEGSSALNTGTSESAPSADMNGTPRPLPNDGVSYDRGCLEQATGIPLLDPVYVAVYGSDSNSGTSSGDPFLTVQYALNRCAANGHVYALTGKFNDKSVYWPGRSNITIQGDGTGLTTIDAQSLGRIFKVPLPVVLSIESIALNNGYSGYNYTGGAINLTAGSILKLTDTLFSGNVSSGGDPAWSAGGGCIYALGSTVEVVNSEFKSNSSNLQAGVGLGGNWTITNSLFYDNVSIWWLNGGTFANAKLKIINSTFLDNNAVDGTGDVANQCTIEAINSIFWGTVSNKRDPFSGTYSGSTLKYCDIVSADADGMTVTECISTEPRFASITWGNANFLKLDMGSPCIDGGTTEGAPADDKIGNIRPRGFGVDMGAYEFQGISIRVLQPNGGENLFLGEPYTITWITSPAADSGGINARLTTNEALSWTLISEEVDDTGYITWEVRGGVSGLCLISIEAFGNGLWNYDRSDNLFAIGVILYPPTSLSAIAYPSSAPDRVRLTWTATTAEALQGYYIYRGLTPESYDPDPLNITPVTFETYDDLTVSAETSYYYAVKTYGWGSYSGFSNDATAPLMKMTRLTSVLAPVSGGYGGNSDDPVPGSTIKYTLKYENIGYGIADNIIIVDKIPLNTEYKLGSATAEASNSITYSINDGASYDYVPGDVGYVDPAVTNISWEVQAMDPGMVKTCTFEVIIK